MSSVPPRSSPEKRRSQPLQSGLELVGWLALCFGAAAFGAQFQPDAWYEALEKPAWNPPAAVFAPVWTTLYALMAVAAWRVGRARFERRVGAALAVFVVQLGVNAAWSWLFFGRHQPGWAFVDVAVLWVLIAATIVLFWKVSRTAALLLVPYWAWVSFASVLNFTIWRMNA